jgi:hypothetical protein
LRAGGGAAGSAHVRVREQKHALPLPRRTAVERRADEHRRPAVSRVVSARDIAPQFNAEPILRPLDGARAGCLRRTSRYRPRTRSTSRRPLSAASAARGRPTSVPALRSLFQF